MENQIDFNEYPINCVLDILLKDNTTGKNIIWATESYIDRGKEYSDRFEILKKNIIGKNSTLIQPRAFKSEIEQRTRTRSKGEVFTPSWLVNRMNNILDEMWFGIKNPFTFELEKSWKRNDHPISFPRGRGFKKYLERTVLEICCGESPFIISRYDAVTGMSISIEQRVGLLDRKLQIISEKNKTEKTWLENVKIAFKHTYGYEYQGDNLLITRVNLLLTFVEFYQYQFKKNPSMEELKSIADIISHNFWQMDGLTKTVPLGIPESRIQQLTLFSWEESAPLCKIKTWKKDPSFILFSQVSEKERQIYLKKGEKMATFDVIIGNPPYQEETGGDGENNRQKPSKSVFHLFQLASDEICSDHSVMIYPGKRWIHRSGKGMNDFGLKQINDPNLERIDYYPKAQDIFPSTGINDGITIVTKNYNKQSSGFDYHYLTNGEERIIQVDNPGEDLLILNPDDSQIMSKVSKIVKKLGWTYLHDRVLSRSLFGIESDFIQNNKNLAILYDETQSYDWTTYCKLYANDKGGSAGRTKLYVIRRMDIPKRRDLIGEWQVAVISANPGGQRRDNQLQLIDNLTAFGRAKVGLGTFKNREEAENLYKYCQSYFVKYCLLMTDENLTSLAKRVPDLGDYSSKNPFIDFQKPLDQQLFTLFQLTSTEQEYILNLIKEREEKRQR